MRISGKLPGLAFLFLGSPWSPWADILGADSTTRLQRVLEKPRFTGRIEATLEARLGRPLDSVRDNLGRLLFPRSLTGLPGAWPAWAK